MSTDDTSILPIIEKLRLSPLFNLSLASKELFHSNFLAWLCSTYPACVGKFFARFVNEMPDEFDRMGVYRERRCIDLTLKYENGEQLLIENKVKSIPSKEQLHEISSCVAEKDREQTSFLLLSLVRPTFLPEGEQIIQFDDEDSLWPYISYGDLANVLKMQLPEIVEANSYHGELLKDYVDFIGNLDKFQSFFAIDWDDDVYDFFIVKSVMKHIRGIRLHDLVEKCRYEQLARRVEGVLRDEGFCVRYGDISSSAKVKVLHAKNPDVKVFADSGMTRSTGYSDFKYVVAVDGDTPVTLGVQLQENTLKLFLEMANKAKAEDAANALWQPIAGKRIWYDFDSVVGKFDENPKKKTFNEYSGTFFYRYIRLGPISPKSLVEIIVKYIYLIRENEAAIRQQLAGLLRS